MLTRNRYQRLIHEQYPYMQEDIERRGMAAYVSEVAIDAGLIQTPEFMRSRRFATSSLGSQHGCDAEERGVIHLQSMEPSKTGSNSCLPYEIEEYEPARKGNYE